MLIGELGSMISAVTDQVSQESAAESAGSEMVEARFFITGTGALNVLFSGTVTSSSSGMAVSSSTSSVARAEKLLLTGIEGEDIVLFLLLMFSAGLVSIAAAAVAVSCWTVSCCCCCWIDSRLGQLQPNAVTSAFSHSSLSVVLTFLMYFLFITRCAKFFAAVLSVSLMYVSQSSFVFVSNCVLMCSEIIILMSCFIDNFRLSSFVFSSPSAAGGERNSNNSSTFLSTGFGRCCQLFAWWRNCVPLYSLFRAALKAVLSV